MPTRPHPARRWLTAATWPVGVSLTSWDYMWRSTVLHRREVLEPSADGHLSPAWPEGVDASEVMGVPDGYGPLFHRRYRTEIREAKLCPDELFQRLTANLNRAAPIKFARFQRLFGDKGTMAVGDEYVVRMPGPWDGPVRVIDLQDRSFRLATLATHLEAGQIEFRAAVDGDRLVFTIESWARSGDRLSNVLYGQLRMAKEVQLHMWTSVMEHAVRLAGGRMVGGIDIETRRVGRPSAGGERMLGDPDARKDLDALHDKELDFDLGDGDEFTPERGWHVDHYCEPLPAEVPGPPVPGGAWEVAQGLMRSYEFADPAIVRAVYYPDRPLDERDMLLEARFYGLRFELGVRVGGARDEVREVGGRKVRVWGWNYRTLQGHLEMGQMDYEVWKWLDSGQVEFRISAFSRRARTANPVVRLGFRVFGRHEQVKSARHACARMATLTKAALGDREPGEIRSADDAVAEPPSGAGDLSRPGYLPSPGLGRCRVAR
ncbi:MAG: hypothetical protein DLM58_16255 [Pseudonocardiales bacterium]|nr:MAG: hypothetical protein DLM58_16255 [Pseudonocardiales bacterium]